MDEKDLPLGKLLPLEKDEKIVPLNQVLYEIGNTGIRELIPNFIAPIKDIQLQLDWPIGKEKK